MPFFLPFYILLRPRTAFSYCPGCGTRNAISAERCRHCDLEIKQRDDISIRGEWKLSDSIAIYALAAFTLPMSLMGLLVALRLMEWDGAKANWSALFSSSLAGSSLLIVLSLWFIIKVCRRPLSDVGLTAKHLYKNMILGVVLYEEDWGF